MKSKGNNNKPVLKVVTTKTLQPPKRYHSADVCLAAVTRPRHNSFGFSTTGRATSLQRVLKNVLECDLTSPLYLSVLQHFGGDEDKFNIIDYFLCDQTYFENLSYSETVIENPKEKDPTKVITRVERYHVPNYLRARCIFFKKFLEDKKNNGDDLNYESF
jgi:hypothetical protein